VPRDDHVWLRRRGHTRIVDDDDWGFVGNDKESRTRAFASTCCACVTVSAPTSASRHAPETHCGRRCTTTTAAWAAPSLTHCSSGGGSTLRGRNATERRRVPHLADNGFVLRRTIGWARRTRAEVRALREARRDTRRKAPPSTRTGRCSCARRRSTRGSSASRRAVRGALSPCRYPTPTATAYTNTSCAIRTVAAGQLLAAVGDDRVFTRPSPLLTQPAADNRAVGAVRQGAAPPCPSPRPRRGEHSVTEKEARCRSVVILMVSRLILCQVTCNLCIRNVYDVNKRVSINVTFYAGFDVSDHI